ncbi:hypothetical protein CHARACLAT_004249, partial [Characodon lateralis]|nr:hypothetical protein [Characodon lateralis]
LIVHRLAARTVIRSLESEQRTDGEQQDEEMKKKVVELSVQSGVSSSFTAFIAVNKDGGKAVQGPLVRRNIPTPLLGAYLTMPDCQLSSNAEMMDYLCCDGVPIVCQSIHESCKYTSKTPFIHPSIYTSFAMHISSVH